LEPWPRFNNSSSNNDNNNDYTGHYAAVVPPFPYPTSPSSISPYAGMRSPWNGRTHIHTNPFKAEWTEDNDGGYD
jgi:hypothetical protein